jgi:hypothetical protein
MVPGHKPDGLPTAMQPVQRTWLGGLRAGSDDDAATRASRSV